MPAGLQSIRKAALLPRWRGNAMETAEEAAGRGQGRSGAVLGGA